MSNHPKPSKNISEKSILAFICLTFLISVLSGCNSNNYGIDKNEITSIRISSLAYPFVETTDRDEILSIINYLSSLNVEKLKEKSVSLTYEVFIVRIKFKNLEEKLFELDAKEYMKESERFGYGLKAAYKIPKEQAVKFKSIYVDMYRKAKIKEGEPSISGKVASLKFNSGAQITSCTLEDNNNNTYDIFVQNAKYINATEKNWRNLFNDDIVEVFCKKDYKNSNGELVATTIIIYKSENSP